MTRVQRLRHGWTIYRGQRKKWLNIAFRSRVQFRKSHKQNNHCIILGSKNTRVNASRPGGDFTPSPTGHQRVNVASDDVQNITAATAATVAVYARQTC